MWDARERNEKQLIRQKGARGWRKRTSGQGKSSKIEETGENVRRRERVCVRVFGSWIRLISHYFRTIICWLFPVAISRRYIIFISEQTFHPRARKDYICSRNYYFHRRSRRRRKRGDRKFRTNCPRPESRMYQTDWRRRQNIQLITERSRRPAHEPTKGEEREKKSNRKKENTQQNTATHAARRTQSIIKVLSI